MNRRQSWNIITLFCILIFGFTLATFLKPTDQFSETENRSLAKMPEITGEAVLNGSFEEDYEAYLTDQFVLRDGWIGLKTSIERFLLRQESKEIYFAEDGYLIEKHTGSFTSDNARNNLAILKQFVEQYQEKFGKEHLSVLIIPNAVDILRDKLPAYASPYDEELYLDQLQEFVPRESWTDASETLQLHKEENLFYRTDHHWTTLGAFYVYKQWAEEQGYESPELSDYTVETVTEEFEGTIQSKLGIQTLKDTIQRFVPKEDLFYTVQTNDGEIEYDLYDDKALNTKNKYDYFFGGNQAIVRLTTRQNTGRKLLLIKDSYSHCFVPFLLKHFDEITMIDIRYYAQRISDLIAENEYTDLMLLYNVSGFAEETTMARITF